MESVNTQFSAPKDRSRAAQLAHNALSLIWQVVRIPFAAALVLIEPIVGFVLAGLAILGVIAALFRALAGVGPNVAVWGMLAFSGGCLLLLAVYYAVMRLFTRP